MMKAGEAIMREAERQMVASVIVAAEACVNTYNSDEHAGRTERDEAMAEPIQALATALTVLDAHTRSQGAQTAAPCTCIIGNDTLKVTTSVMQCAVHRDSEIGRTERELVEAQEAGKDEETTT
jgi:hypothetical protein